MRSLLISTVLVLFASACGGHDAGGIDNTIGAPCTSDRDCDSRCFVDNNDFPGGFCSVPCQSDNDCPSDTYCIDKAGGVCMFACPAFDCSRLGTNWACKDKARVSGGGVTVCIGD